MLAASGHLDGMRILETYFDIRPSTSRWRCEFSNRSLRLRKQAATELDQLLASSVCQPPSLFVMNQRLIERQCQAAFVVQYP